MLQLSYTTAGFYSNTLIDADTNVPIKSIVLRQLFISKFSSFVGESTTSFCTRAKSNFATLLFGHKPTFNKRQS